MYGKARERRTGSANSSECNAAERPSSLARRETSQEANAVVASLSKGTPLAAGRALPWPLGMTLMVYSSAG